MQTEDWLLAGILLTGMYLSVRFHKLDLPGAIMGGVLACFIYLGGGFTGVVIMTAFFLMGTLATGHKLAVKESWKVAESSRGKRNFIQVLSNAGIPALCGLLAWIYSENASLFRLMLAAGFSSATADTLSSELGTVYGKKFYNILTLQKEQRGLDGVISIEGTFFGVLGSMVIALLFSFSYGFNLEFLWILIAGTIGNLSDSLLGATFQRRHYINNNGVNLFNTLLAALTAGFLHYLE